MRQKIQIIEGNTINIVETSYPGLALTVMFGNGCKLSLFPDGEEDSKLPYWEIFTPYQMVLKVGPGSMWSYTPSGYLKGN